MCKRSGEEKNADFRLWSGCCGKVMALRAKANVPTCKKRERENCSSTFNLSSVFPASFNLPSFKRQVCHHFRGLMTCFFFFFFFFFAYILLLFPFLAILAIFYYFSLSSSFSYGIRSRARVQCDRSVFPFIKKINN